MGKLDPVGKYYLLSQLNGRRPVQKWTTPMVPSDAELAERVEASEVQFTLLRHFDPGVYRKQLAAAADGGSRYLYRSGILYSLHNLTPYTTQPLSAQVVKLQ